MTARLRVAMLGTAFMGRAHSRAWREAGRVFDLPVELDCDLLVGRDPERTAAAASRLGFRRWSVDWPSAVADSAIDIVDICLPVDLHAEIATAALDAGKHVLCEKPLATSLTAAARMAAAAGNGDTRTFAMVGFNYRRVPALALARQLVGSGHLGEIRQLSARYLQDWLVDPAVPMTWRLSAERAGSGALGDLGSHLVDMARWLLGQEVEAVSASLETFVRRRPAAGSRSSRPLQAGDGLGDVTVDDAAIALLRFSGGAFGTLDASRVAAGRKNELSVELHGERGGIRFNLERLNELEVYQTPGRDSGPLATPGFRKVMVTEGEHPYLGAWWPPGHVLGWEHTFLHQAADFVTALAEGRQPQPSFHDGLITQAVLEAAAVSAVQHRWVRPADLLAGVSQPVKP